MKITIPGWKAFQYAEVWRVTEYRKGDVYKTEFTEKYIKSGTPLPNGFIESTISPDKERPTMELELFSPEEKT